MLDHSRTTTNPELTAFEELFYRDLEKWFSADIACCDYCHDDFLFNWPYADHADGYSFQRASISMDCFYSGSYLQDYVSRADFDRLICQLECPRCGSPLGGNIWAYDLPFNVPYNIEKTLRKIGETAKATPFLLLKHELCQRIFSAIRALALTISPQKIEQTLFRGRNNTDGSVQEDLAAFDFPPNQVVQEGRYNHAGHSVLYLGSDIDTCHSELRGVRTLVAEFHLEAELKVLDLTNPYSHATGKFEDADLLNCLVYSALMSSQQEDSGFYRPHYVVSRFVADCTRTAGFDGIKYPSTRRTGKNFNLVIVNKKLSLSTISSSLKFHYRDAV